MSIKIFIRLILILLFTGKVYGQTYDICVYGATSAGVMAAYTAKIQGKSVILLEPSTHIGGLTTGGLGQTDIGNKYAITGLSRDFYRKIGQHYGKFEQWTFEPKVASKIFNDYLKKANMEVKTQMELISVFKNLNSITAIELKNPKGQLTKIRAKYFIDCTYEGDLMAKAGVSYTVGREDNRKYGETWNGVQMLDKHQFPDGIDPFKIAGDSTSGLLWGISQGKLAPKGSGDEKVQAYNFRMCLTDSMPNMIPITAPEDYYPSRYELLLRYIEKKQPYELNWALMHLQPMPNRKLDINNSGPFSSNLIGGNYDYPNSNYAQRKAIQKAHENHIRGFFYFLGNDPRVPEHLRNEMKKWGYPKDEFINNGHFSPQMYVREARRMISDVIMTEKHCVGEETVSDGIGMAAYTMDSHNTQRIIVKDADGKYQVKNEGDVQMGLGGLDPYPISYKAIIPQKTECNNLLVPVCLSASHIAFGSIRMEPVFMVLAQSAAMAAVLAVESKKNLHEIDIPKLQNLLKSNPLADGSRREILIDNSFVNQFSAIGDHEVIKKQYGRYGKDFVKMGSKSEAIFSTKIDQGGNYVLQLYFPKRENSSEKLKILVKYGEKMIEKVIKVDSEANDWYEFGNINFLKNQDVKVTISSLSGKEFIADAILFVPLR
ncbi:FAD-dependent oxidoreductase [Lacihabitans soyangensis]|uniref:FAD-dependent oxidoreductase n=1 Tax=Lacihabitans soyangensis TaxID=869394 RepID=A0AAE3H0G8_9BACT|nr:FAD-dependent oxidoreductase [Lacihabitans soyangensis]MCP9761714.1 FAD-dependent oxidoreductase [Lacihabitans soyangensis]